MAQRYGGGKNRVGAYRGEITCQAPRGSWRPASTRIVDTGLADLADGTISPESLAVSLAAPRLRREGVPVGSVHDDPEDRLYDMLSAATGDLAHARYAAYLEQIASFADACRFARLRRASDAK